MRNKPDFVIFWSLKTKEWEIVKDVRRSHEVKEVKEVEVVTEVEQVRMDVTVLNFSWAISGVVSSLFIYLVITFPG